VSDAKPGEATPGQIMAREIAEQPAVLERILTEDCRASARRPSGEGGLAALRSAHRPRTSDNAAYYAKYLMEIALACRSGDLDVDHDGLPRRAGPSGRAVRDGLAVGGSPDLVAYTEMAKARGGLTLAVTNVAGSPVNQASELSLDVLAGPELALPATKTYTAELLTLWLLVDALRGGDGSAAKALPDLAAAVLAREPEVVDLAQRYRFAPPGADRARVFVPTVREAALKIMETSYLPAHAFSGADLLHGPLAMVDNVSPVVAVAAEGAGGTALEPVLSGCTARRGPGRGRLGRTRGRGHRGLCTAHRHPGGAVADPGDPAAPAAGLPRDDEPGPEPGRAAGAGEGDADALSGRLPRAGSGPAGPFGDRRALSFPCF